MTTTLPPEYDLERFESVVSNLPVLTYTADLTERFVSRCLSQIVLAAESYAASGGVVPEVDAQTLVEGEVALVQREFRLLQQTNAELCAILTGVFQVAQALRAQRDQALEAVDAQQPTRVWQHIVDTMASVQGIPDHMADLLASLLLTSDQEILGSDWTDLDGLLRFRDQLTELLNGLAAGEGQGV